MRFLNKENIQMTRKYASTHVKPCEVPRLPFRGFCAALCMTVGFLQGGAAAQDALLTGTWYHEGDSTESAQRAERAQRYEAIDRATEGMNSLMRGRAREMLRAKTTPPPKINLADKGDQVTVSVGDRQITCSTDGSPRRVSGEGGAGTIQAVRQNGQLVLTARANNGVKTTVYRLSDDRKRLTLDISMTSKTLEKPIRYQVTYISRSEYERRRTHEHP
jgi:hypothetical protein